MKTNIKTTEEMQMMSLSKSLNFSQYQENQNAIKMPKWRDINFYETLTLYCADNDIDMRQFEESDIDSAVEIMSQHGTNDAENGHYYFWIDFVGGEL